MEDYEVQAATGDSEVNEQLNMTNRRKKRLVRRATRKAKKANKLMDEAGIPDPSSDTGSGDGGADMLNQPDNAEVTQQNQDLDQIVEEGMQDATTDAGDDNSMVIGFDAQEKLSAAGKGKKAAAAPASDAPASDAPADKSAKAWYKKPVVLIGGGVVILGLGILAFVKLRKKK